MSRKRRQEAIIEEQATRQRRIDEMRQSDELRQAWLLVNPKPPTNYFLGVRDPYTGLDIPLRDEARIRRVSLLPTTFPSGEGVFWLPPELQRKVMGQLYRGRPLAIHNIEEARRFIALRDWQRQYREMVERINSG